MKPPPSKTEEGSSDQADLRIIPINPGGTNDKEDLIIVTLKFNNIDVALITETHRTPDSLQQKLNRTGYRIFKNPTQDNSFNGTAILVKNSLTTSYQHSIIKPGRLQKIKFSLQNHTYHIICAYLQSGSSSQIQENRAEDFRLLNNTICDIQSTEDVIILGGRFQHGRISPGHRQPPEFPPYHRRCRL